MLNRTAPDSYRVADNGWSIDRGHHALAEIVKRQGWEQEGYALYMAPSPETRKRVEVPSLQTKARDYENATGAKSAERVAIESAADALKAVSSWSDVHAALTAKGMRYEQKGSGALLWVGDTAVKASSVGREFSRKRMEERFGPFEARPSDSSPKIAKPLLMPMKEPTSQWLEYRSLVASWTTRRDQAQAGQRSGHQRAKEDQSKAFRQERTNLYGGTRWAGTELNVARSLLAAEHAKRKAALIDTQRHERSALRERFGSRPSFEEFLRSEGQEQLAQEWRYRNASARVGTISGEGEAREATRDVRDFTARVGRDGTEGNSFVGYFQTLAGNRCSFADRGNRIDVYQTNDRAVVLAALQVASQKWAVLAITGPPEFQVLCAELAREHGFLIQNLAAPKVLNVVDIPAPEASKRVQGESVYDVHRRDILSKLSVKNPSQLDWMIAVRMRTTGHSKDAIADELRKHTEGTRSSEERDWARYSQRTVDAVFGPRGDREAGKLNARKAAWLNIEGQAVSTSRTLYPSTNSDQTRKSQRRLSERER